MLNLPAKHPILYSKLLRIRRAVYTEVAPLQADILRSDEPIPFSQLSGREFVPLRPGAAWGEKYDCAWLHITGRVPEDARDTVILLGLRGEGLVYSPQGEVLDSTSTVYILGDLPHSGGLYRPVRGADLSGGSVDLYADIAYNGILLYDYGSAVYHGAYLARRNEAVYAYYYDFLTLFVLAAATEDMAYAAELKAALNASYGSFAAAGAVAARTLLARCLASPSYADFTYSAIGHGHLDMAWLWPLRETHRKAARTYVKALNNLEERPDYLYGTSQPQQLLWMKKEHPALYQRIKQAVADGRMELQGAFWVECDSNITGAESLVRQAVFGRRFLREEFGKSTEDIRLCWLPDAFGFSGNLPQILKKSGMDWFSTIKLAWNKKNVFPYRSFYWQGIDGSTVLAHMPPEGDYNSRAAADGLLNGVKKYPEKELGRALLAYGAGDGGGGPGEVHLELTEREHSLRGLPRVRYATADSFFAWLEGQSVPHTHVGELYLETHQGTYTTQGKIKYYNRLLERRLHEAEALAVFTGRDCRESLRPLWEDMLLNQFHDIIPGSSITRVNREAAETYAAIEAALDEYTTGLLAALPGAGKAPCAANLTSFARSEVVEQNGRWYAAEVGPYAAARLAPFAGDERLSVTTDGISNGLVTLRFDASGEITGCTGPNGQEQSAGGLNRLVLHPDPYQFPFDAWDIRQDYHQRGRRRLKAKSVHSAVAGAEVARTHTYRFGKSTVTQRVALRTGSDVIRFETTVDWRESHKMLRAEFYPAHYGDTVFCDIQFGHIARPTTENGPIEAAQFEIFAHKWVAVQDGAGGFALLNDCKYGHRAKNGLLSLNLLRAPTFPDKTADRGVHRFTYAACPFAPGEGLAKVVREGYRLNSPLLPTPGAVFESFAEMSDEAVVIETIKPAEDGKGTVLRLYESLGAPADAALRTRLPHSAAFETNLLEEDPAPIDLAALHFTPFEIKTILLRP